MKHIHRYVLLYGFVVLAAFGARPVATLTSAEPFSLDGHSMNTPGVTRFPVVVGDTVATSKGTAVLLFTDGSSLKMNANSSVQITGVEAKPKIVLLSGALDYKLIPGSPVSVTNLDSEHKMAPAPRPAASAAAASRVAPAIPIQLSPRALAPVLFARNQPAQDPSQPVRLATASYVGADTATLGTWTGRYGSDGQVIPTLLTNVPAYAKLSLAGNAANVIEANSSDARALQTASAATTRIVSNFSNNFTINVNLTDGYTHRIALYLCDFENLGRSETVTIVDANTKEVLSTQAVSAFNGSVYEVWNIVGHVLIQIATTGNSSAVVNGIFFDPPGALPTGNEPQPGQGGNSGASAAPNSNTPLFANPKFLVPLAGLAAAGLAAGLLSLPPVSRRL